MRWYVLAEIDKTMVSSGGPGSLASFLVDKIVLFVHRQEDRACSQVR